MTGDGCPICSKPADAKYAPFCSRRCADVDLSRWLKGSYAIPGKPAGEEDENTRENGPKSAENDES
ncbi:MAG: DNA gyrase inhibitor YacG [Hyphomonadaceae bacterium]|nr:DNA gyrase inhibitor YacG [Hyphomonadaceae bacterium]